MGSFLYPITLIGPTGEMTLGALVDTGATYTWMPRPILESLGIAPSDRQQIVLADGRLAEYGLAQVRARIDGKERVTICIFGDAGTEPLLGVVTLEEFCLGVDPVGRRLMPVPGRLKVTKGVRYLPTLS